MQRCYKYPPTPLSEHKVMCTAMGPFSRDYGTCYKVSGIISRVYTLFLSRFFTNPSLVLRLLHQNWVQGYSNSTIKTIRYIYSYLCPFFPQFRPTVRLKSLHSAVEYLVTEQFMVQKVQVISWHFGEHS